jgi:hypothetical protein
MVDFGSAVQRSPDGILLPVYRTHARAEYTKALLAIHPWADTVDLEIFLMGFDAGEQWSRHTMGMERNKHPDNATWLDLVEKDAGYIPDKIAV